MEVQSLVTQNLVSKFIPYLPSHKSYAQFKYSVSSKIHRSYKFECNIGYCRSVYHGNARDLKSSSVRDRRMKPTRRTCISLASKNNNEQPLPEEENPEEKDESDITGSVQNLDWRAFRAKLFTAEQIGKSSKNDSRCGSEAESCSEISVGSKWAHPLYEPEPGCVLIATETLDGTQDFERTVILLLHVDAECPFGLILNRPKHSSPIHSRPTHPDMATVFADCPLRFGGPLEENMFLLISEDKNGVLGIVRRLKVASLDHKNVSSVERKVRALQRLVPGGKDMKNIDLLFQETADYIVNLQMQVHVMQALADFCPAGYTDRCVDEEFHKSSAFQLVSR